MEDDEDPTVPGHKLCGYLCAVLTVAPSSPLPRLGARLLLSSESASVAFRSPDGVVLSPPRSPEPRDAASAVEIAPSPPTPPGRRSGKKRKAKKRGDSAEPKRKGTAARRRRSIGMVNGSASVAEQLGALVAHRCLRIAARIVWTGDRGGGEGGEVRAVVLVDVYVPVEVWEGWQFPRAGSVAGALFRHLRYPVALFHC